MIFGGVYERLSSIRRDDSISASSRPSSSKPSSSTCWPVFAHYPALGEPRVGPHDKLAFLTKETPHGGRTSSTTRLVHEQVNASLADGKVFIDTATTE